MFLFLEIRLQYGAGLRPAARARLEHHHPAHLERSGDRQAREKLADPAFLQQRQVVHARDEDAEPALLHQLDDVDAGLPEEVEHYLAVLDAPALDALARELLVEHRGIRL